MRWLSLSWRGLAARRSRSLLTALAVSVATCGLTVFLSLGAGLRAAVRGQVDAIRPQLQVSRGGLLSSLAPPPDMSERVVNQIGQLARVSQERAPGIRFATPIILQRDQRDGLNVTLYGVPAAAGFGRVYPFARAASGRLLSSEDEGENVVVLGAALARRTAGSYRVGAVTLRVIGVLQETRTLTDAFAVVPLTTLQRALGVEGFVSLVAVEVEPGADVPRVAAALRARVDAEVHTQREAREVSARLLRAADLTGVALAAVALLVGFLSVMTTMTMAAAERRGELATLRALGLRPGGAAGLLLLDGAVLSLAGGFAGTLAGGAVSLGAGTLSWHLVGVRATVTTPGVVLAVLLASFLLGVLAALPAAAAVGRARLGEALRGAGA